MPLKKTSWKKGGIKKSQNWLSLNEYAVGAGVSLWSRCLWPCCGAGLYLDAAYICPMVRPGMAARITGRVKLVRACSAKRPNQTIQVRAFPISPEVERILASSKILLKSQPPPDARITKSTRRLESGAIIRMRSNDFSGHLRRRMFRTMQ